MALSTGTETTAVDARDAGKRIDFSMPSTCVVSEQKDASWDDMAPTWLTTQVADATNAAWRTTSSPASTSVRDERAVHDADSTPGPPSRV